MKSPFIDIKFVILNVFSQKRISFALFFLIVLRGIEKSV
jgi:hypothetical protein